jgi:Helix-turn-helix domain
MKAKKLAAAPPVAESTANGQHQRPLAADHGEPTMMRRRRLIDKDVSAEYLSISTDTVERLIHAGELPVVKLPVERADSGRGKVGTSRRVLIDVRDLDALIERSKEKFGR